jgi:hypothetical protein
MRGHKTDLNLTTEAKSTTIYVKMEDRSLYNSRFSMKEIQEALKTCVGSSPEPDDNNYEMIKLLGEKEAVRLFSGKLENNPYHTHTKTRKGSR